MSNDVMPELLQYHEKRAQARISGLCSFVAVTSATVLFGISSGIYYTAGADASSSVFWMGVAMLGLSVLFYVSAYAQLHGGYPEQALSAAGLGIDHPAADDWREDLKARGAFDSDDGGSA